MILDELIEKLQEYKTLFAHRGVKVEGELKLTVEQLENLDMRVVIPNGSPTKTK